MLNRLWSWFGRKSPEPPRRKSTSRPASRKARSSSSPRPAAHEPVTAERPIPRGKLDPDALKIVQRLSRYDHQAYLVGGCVRDLLVGLSPKDFDIGTSATPRQIKRLFRNSRIIGRRFRLVHVFFQGGKIIEVATFRSGEEGSEGDGDLLITDDNRFGTLEQDAIRRDFTVNQLFYDVAKRTVIDHCGGLEDLEKRSIRTIGDPEVRFKEDPIRLLRAIKFAARMDFEIEAKTLKALRDTRNEIPKAAPPRILEEINRFCRGGRGRRSFELMRDTGIFDVVLPELSKAYRDENAWKWLIPQLNAIDAMWKDGNEPPTGLIFAALLLPVLRERFGWSEDGRAEPPRGIAVRELVDDILQPIAQRLRVPRREQELCRQVLTTLQRMVPDKQLRPRARAAIRRRACLDQVMLLLGAVAAQHAGDFEEAYERWCGRMKEDDDAGNARDRGAGEGGEDGEGGGRRRKRRGRRGGRGRRRKRTEESEESSPEEQQESQERSDDSGEERPSRRRGRRGGRGRRRRGSGSGEGGSESEAARESTPPPPRRKDGKWDDYFFDALPSAPVSAGKGDGLPYGREPEDEKKDD